MSFSADVKTELLSNIKNTNCKHCKVAMLTAIINICGFCSTESYNKFIAIHNENIEIMNLAVSFLKEIFDVKVTPINSEIVISDRGLIDEIINTLGIRDSSDFSLNSPIKPEIVTRNCCKRAYIRTAFVCCGSVNDPSKHYHLEFADNDYEHLQSVAEIIADFGIEMKIVERKNHFVIYCKDAELIVDLLNVMSAVKALFELENTRVVKEVRNNINRIVNCETANINKIVSTAVRQVEDIEYIGKIKGMDYLSENLKAVAEVRLKYPDASLKELGEYLSPPIGKSGVNHRLKKIHKIAENLKGDI